MINGENLVPASIPWGMVGGGRQSQIGYIHRSAALRDGVFKLVAGAFDIDAQRGRDFGTAIGVEAGRCYADYKAMFATEVQRPDGIRAVSIATPNGTHFAISKAALEAGLHVVCEKPLCFTTAEAEELRTLAAAKNKIVGVTYGYAGHQLIEQARDMIAAGELGDMAYRANQAGYPAEAQRLLDEGFDGGVLGKDGNAVAARALLDQVVRAQPSGIIAKAIRIYSWNIDFQRDIQPGLDLELLGFEPADRLIAVVEPRGPGLAGARHRAARQWWVHRPTRK